MEKFIKVNPKVYAECLRQKFKDDPQLWYSAISPKEIADSFRKKYNDDFSECWHVHCRECWIPINKNTAQDCYCTEDETLWLCADCYKELREEDNK